VQVDELISSAEREFSSADLPLEPTRAEMMLREHEASRSKVKHLLDCTAGEGDEIVVRVRQQVDCSGAARAGRGARPEIGFTRKFLAAPLS